MARQRQTTATETPKVSPPVYLVTPEVAAQLRVAPRTVEGWRAAGTGPAFLRQANGRALYRQDDVIRFAERHCVSTLDQQVQA